MESSDTLFFTLYGSEIFAIYDQQTLLITVPSDLQGWPNNVDSVGYVLLIKSRFKLLDFHI